jgi:autotransporter-associated beta strand protein
VEAFGYDNAVTNPVLGGLSDNRPTAVTIFSKGAVIDTSNAVVGVSAPLLAPAGQGVVSIPLPAGASLSGYIAPPLVTISGDGTNATAIATIDSRTGTWTGITVTSPGWGYTTATASISRGGKTDTFEVACVLGDVSGGGLTKRGSGELHLKAVNTYTGATVVEKGRLVLEEGSSIASSSGVSVADGATLEVASGGTLPVGALGGCGSIDGDVTVDGVVAIKASDLVEGRYLDISGSVQFGSGASIAIENDIDLPVRKNYTLLQASSGITEGSLPAISGVGRNRAIFVVGGKVRLVYLRHAVIFR